MRKSKAIILALLIGFLAGCASSEKAVPSSATPLRSVGYVDGNFVLGKPIFTSAFVLVDQATSAEHILSFSSVPVVQAGHEETSLIALPPGTYRVTEWIVYNSHWGPGAGNREGKKAVPPGRLAEPFTVKGDEVVFLGKFYAEYGSASYLEFRGSWKTERVSQERARDYLKAAYPKFSAVDFTCITCSP